MIIKEIDFNLVKDKVEDKVFILTNDDNTVYNMTGSTVVCKFYKAPTPPIDITCDIHLVNGTITIPFTAVHADALGNYEYIVEETKSDSSVISLVKGNIIILDYVPFSETIEAYFRSELPANLTLTPDYRNQRIFYWRRILQTAFEITDANLNIETAWPTLVNALLAKLVVYDALMLSASGSFAAFLGGDYTDSTTAGAGAVKSVETGPVRVEYFDAASSAKNAFVSSAGGISMFETLKQGLCGLANYLKVKIPMCDGNIMPIAPQFAQNPDWAITTLDETIESQG